MRDWGWGAGFLTPKSTSRNPCLILLNPPRDPALKGRSCGAHTSSGRDPSCRLQTPSQHPRGSPGLGAPRSVPSCPSLCPVSLSLHLRPWLLPLWPLLLYRPAPPPSLRTPSPPVENSLNPCPCVPVLREEPGAEGPRGLSEDWGGGLLAWCLPAGLILQGNGHPQRPRMRVCAGP